jgi:tRNA modification GTPase
MDTAGIRKADDLIEMEGIRRSKEAMGQADLILLVLDVAKGIEAEDLWLMEQVPKDKTIAIWNKSDLPHALVPAIEFAHVVAISAKSGIGLDNLHRKIDEVIWENGPPSKEEVLITNLRHKESLENAISSCKKLIEGLNTGISPEFLSMDMRQCLKELGTIIGTNITEDILSAIFSKFCIGK